MKRPLNIASRYVVIRKYKTARELGLTESALREQVRITYDIVSELVKE